MRDLVVYLTSRMVDRTVVVKTTQRSVLLSLSFRNPAPAMAVTRFSMSQMRKSMVTLVPPG